MNAKKLLSLWGLKWNPFSPELPSDALLATAKIEHFVWRVEQLVQEGGFSLISGESGTGKSVALRTIALRLSRLRDVVVGVLERPQSRNATSIMNSAISSRSSSAPPIVGVTWRAARLRRAYPPSGEGTLKKSRVIHRNLEAPVPGLVVNNGLSFSPPSTACQVR